MDTEAKRILRQYVSPEMEAENRNAGGEPAADPIDNRHHIFRRIEHRSISSEYQFPR